MLIWKCGLLWLWWTHRRKLSIWEEGEKGISSYFPSPQSHVAHPLYNSNSCMQVSTQESVHLLCLALEHCRQGEVGTWLQPILHQLHNKLATQLGKQRTSSLKEDAACTVLLHLAAQGRIGPFWGTIGLRVPQGEVWLCNDPMQGCV